ncbi:uncharacterized protein LOC144121615 [Amblyomma americanum]
MPWNTRSGPSSLPTKRACPSSPHSCGGSAACRSQPADVSSLRSVPRYAVFVAGVAFIASVCLLVVPAAIVSNAASCEGLGKCLSLEKDLLRSLDKSVHPCDDFYQHVCGGWDDPVSGHDKSPSERYSGHFKDNFLWNMLRRKIPQRPLTAADKVSFMLLSCLKQLGRDGSDELRAFLRDLGLPWPHRSPATRAQLLQSLVKLSLTLGMPTFWAFMIGRHPARPSQNTLYMTMDRRLLEWSHDVDKLHSHGALHQYLRRCAEVLGGTGQSYSLMIANVLEAHENISDIVQEHWQLFCIPRYDNLSDAELRRAVNGHLPDDSQLWPEDEIVNLQPTLFDVLDRFHLTPDENRERFKLFLGAYLVWTVAPLVTSQLAVAMLGDMGYRDSPVSFMSRKCFSSVSFVLPLVAWKLQTNSVQSKHLLWSVFQVVKAALLKALGSYREAIAVRANHVASRLLVNAFNMSATWATVDNIYAFLDMGGPDSISYFHMFRHVSRDTVTLYKQSLRKPRHTMFYVPGVAREPIYRLLVTREVTVPNHWTALALTGSTHSLPVMAAVLGMGQVAQMLALLNFVFFYDEQFTRYPYEELKDDFGGWLAHLKRFERVLEKHSLLPDLTTSDKRQLMRLSLSALVGAHASARPGRDTVGTAPEFASAQRGQWSTSGPASLHGIPKEELFFLVSCFLDCGLKGRQRLLQQTYCNVALPSVPAFGSTFQCNESHRMKTNFTWQKVDDDINVDDS